MNKFKLTPIILSSLVTSFLLVGCGSDSSSAPLTSTDTEGQLVDSYIQNSDYYCADGSHGTTDKDGRFKCKGLPVTFKLGGLKLGEISKLAADKQVFPQDLLGLNRTDTNNSKVIAMARFLQSCDEDNNSKNGLQIRQDIKESLVVEEDFESENIELYTQITVGEEEAQEHLNETIELVESVNDADIPDSIKEGILTPNSTISQELKNTLSYMGNEERLAYDVYNKLYESHPDVKQLTNIANNSERAHIKAVQLLIQKYIKDSSEFTNTDLEELHYRETEVENMQAGVYDISAIADLYDLLVAMGQESSQKALEVGCIVEVTDINDLDHDIVIAEDENATDIVATFEFLRNGSYNHYWAFDKGLKNMGITDGCCSLGADYCHNEYPKNQHGRP